MLTIRATGKITFQVKLKSGANQVNAQELLEEVKRAVTTVSPEYGLPLTMKTATTWTRYTRTSHQQPPIQ